MSRYLVQRCMGALLLAFGVAGLYVATRMLVAAIGYHQAGLFLADWDRRGTAPTAESAELATAAAYRSIKWLPVASGRYYERLGRVLEWQHYDQPFDDADETVRALRTESLRVYREAVRLRPTWPDTWLRLAWAKLYQLELDAEFSQALAQAAALGPWRAHISSGVTEVGLIAWSSLAAAERALVLAAGSRAVQQAAWSRARVLAAAEYTAGMALLCADEALREQLAELCDPPQ
jgi:hypothetical protein